MNIPESTSIVMRPVWRRRQLRLLGLESAWGHPTDEELADAIQVLALPPGDLEFFPELWEEAQLILDEA